MRVCRDCEFYPDDCIEAIRTDRCSRFKLGCNHCPIIYICALRCPYAREVEADLWVGKTDLQCIGYPLLRIFANWLMHRNRSWKEIQGEVTTMQTVTP
ncbi:MAG: hypothetical protein QME81_07005 [bacterium]|nr:hypothetical protein [bacterium]